MLEPLLPVMLCLTVLGGRPELHFRRTMVNAVFYLVDNGIKWRAMPADFPPWRTVWGLLARWRRDGVMSRVVDGCARSCAWPPAARRAVGRSWTPSRCTSPPRASSLPRQRLRQPQERQRPQAPPPGRHPRPAHRRGRHPGERPGPGRGGDAAQARPRPRPAPGPGLGGPGLRGRLAALGRPRARRHRRGRPTARDRQGFQVLPRRWVVERTHAWITRRRRCARDYERLPATTPPWSSGPPSSR